MPNSSRQAGGAHVLGTRPGLEWHVDPIDLALRGSAAARQELPSAFCIEVGRRLLRAELEFSQWVLRRVETVTLAEGRSVLRKLTIEFKVCEDAPTFVVDDKDGSAPRAYWLVPLAIMKRRTLVDFHLANEDGSPLTLPGLRLTQQLDESLLLAAAATTGSPPRSAVREFVRRVVAGDQQAVREAMRGYEADELGDEVAALRRHFFFRMTLERLRYNFTLYVLLSRRRGRHRLLTMSFVEPVEWRYQHADLIPESDGSWHYEPMKFDRWDIGHLASELGLTPTLVRFQTPAAENAASYHLEVIAPPGVRIVGATLLAVRPHVDDDHFTLDRLQGDSLTVGLHAVEVPPNSLCRAQVELRVQTAGWLTTLLVVTLAIFFVLASVAAHALLQEAPASDQDTNVVVLLIATAAAAAAFLSQRDFTGVAARLITGMRTVGAISMALPIVAAGFLSYHEVSRDSSDGESLLPGPAEASTRWASAILSVLALALFLLVLLTWVRTRADEQRQKQTSPWDMSLQARPAPEEEDGLTYRAALTKFGFERHAVGVRSSEGWHHIYRWTDYDHAEARDRLNVASTVDGLPEACVEALRCAGSGVDGCSVHRCQPDGSEPSESDAAPAPPAYAPDNTQVDRWS